MRREDVKIYLAKNIKRLKHMTNNNLFWLILIILVMTIFLFVSLIDHNDDLSNILMGALYASLAGIAGILLQQTFMDLSESKKRKRFLVEIIMELNQNIDIVELSLKPYYEGGSTVSFKGFNVGHLEKFKENRESLFDFNYDTFVIYQNFIDFIHIHEFGTYGKGITKSKEDLNGYKITLNKFLRFIVLAENNNNNFEFEVITSEPE